jgi:DNA-binding response OmpR family regulator
METLLVVEDDVHQAKLYKQELEEDEYKVILAHDGHEALKKLEQEDIDLVILDISMPGMDGIEALGKILGRDNTMPVIIHTAYAQYKDNFMTWTAEHYVIKSSDLGELKAKVRNVLDQRKT